MALPTENPDAFITGLNDQPGEHAGPYGRLKSLSNGIAKRFTHGSDKDYAKYVLTQRTGFHSLTQEVRSAVTGEVLDSDWVSADLLHSVNGHLITVDNRIPRVLADDANAEHWVEYDSDRVVVNKLSERTVWGGYGVTQFSTIAVLSNNVAVTFMGKAGDNYTILFGVQDKSGTWLVKPSVVESSTTPILAHVLTDGSRFWLITDLGASYSAKVYDNSGVFLCQDTFTKLETNLTPAHWDVKLSADIFGELIHVQAGGDTTDPTDDVHVRFTRMFTDGATITFTVADDATVHCNGPVAWSINEQNLTNQLLTVGPGEAEHLYLYSVTGNVSSGQVDVATLPAPVDALTGYWSSADPSNRYAVVGFLETAQENGPQYNPQDRFINTYKVTAGVGSLVRTDVEQCLASRAFRFGSAVNPDWAVTTYYQSGDGLGAGDDTITPAITAGDYFIGSEEQDIAVSAGDYTTGDHFDFALQGVTCSGGMSSSLAITGTDTVAAGSSTGATGSPPAGTPIYVWTFANQPSTCQTPPSLVGQPLNGVFLQGGELVVFGSSGVTGANGHWPIVGGNIGATTIYTLQQKTEDGTGLTPGTFAGGSFSALSLSSYEDDTLPAKLGAGTFGNDIFVGGTLTVTGTSGGNDITGISIARVDMSPITSSPYKRRPAFYVPSGSQTTQASTGQCSSEPATPNVWHFAAEAFTGQEVGSDIVVTDDVNDNNNGTFAVSAATTTELTTGAETNLITELFFSSTLPTVKLQLGDKLPFTFYVQALAPDLAVNSYRFIGATIRFVSSITQNSGDYRITSIDPSLDGTVYAERITSVVNIKNQSLVSPADSITIYLAVATTAPFQPQYFFVPTTGQRATVGAFDRLVAYNDWRIEGVNLLSGHLTDVVSDNIVQNLRLVLPTRQEAVSGQNSEGQQVQGSTVGLKLWEVQSGYGKASETLLPGCQAVSFEQDSFPEDGFALGPEMPWLLSTSTATDTETAMTPHGQYSVYVVWESQDSQGNRVFSPPSPPLTFALTGTANQATYQGKLPFSVDSSGNIVDNVRGITNRKLVAFSLYRNVIRSGIPTLTVYKITNDITPNALAPISTSNPSGFTFSGTTWTYIDQWDDLQVATQEQGYFITALPRFGAPAFSHGCVWQGRQWLLGTDGFTYFSSSATDGNRQSYFPALRVAPPTGESLVSVQPMEQFLLGIGSEHTYYIPASALPSQSLAELGQVGIPSWIPLPYTVGGTGPALTTKAGIVYANEAQDSSGRLFVSTRNLTSDYMSQPIQEFLGARTIVDLAIDKSQRLYGLTSDGKVAVFDFVSSLWTTYSTLSAPSLCCNHKGTLFIRDDNFVSKLTSDSYYDLMDEVVSEIEWGFSLAGLSFNGVRNFVRLKRLQIIGEYLGDHTVKADITYPDDFPNDPTIYAAYTPDPTKPYLLELRPGHGKASQFGVSLVITPFGIDNPGNSCSIELFSALVGVQPGQKQVRAGQRLQ